MSINCSQCSWKYVATADDIPRIACNKPNGIPCPSICTTSINANNERQYYSDGYFSKDFSQFYKELNDVMFTDGVKTSASFQEIRDILNQDSDNIRDNINEVVNRITPGNQSFMNQFFLDNGDLKNDAFSGSGVQGMLCGNDEWNEQHSEYNKYKQSYTDSISADSFRLSPEFDIIRYVNDISSSDSFNVEKYNYSTFNTDLNEMIEDIVGLTDSTGAIRTPGQWNNKESNTKNVETSEQTLIQFLSICKEKMNDIPTITDENASEICTQIYEKDYMNPTKVNDIMNKIRDNTMQTLRDTNLNITTQGFDVDSIKNPYNYGRYPILLTELQLYQNMRIHALNIFDQTDESSLRDVNNLYLSDERDTLLTTEYIQNENFKQCIEDIFGGTKTENAMFTYVRIYNSTNGFEGIDDEHPDMKAFRTVYKQFIRELFNKMSDYNNWKKVYACLVKLGDRKHIQSKVCDFQIPRTFLTFVQLLLGYSGLNMIALQKNTRLNRFILKETIQYSQPILDNLIRMTESVEKNYCSDVGGHKKRNKLIKQYKTMLFEGLANEKEWPLLPLVSDAFQTSVPDIRYIPQAFNKLGQHGQSDSWLSLASNVFILLFTIAVLYILMPR